MITEIAAAMTAIKETVTLAKTISDAKTESDIKIAIGDLQSKLLVLQQECFGLCEIVRSREEEIASLKAEAANREKFASDAEAYVFNKLESGTFVYSRNVTMNGGDVTANACPNCLQQKKISILQPCVNTGVKG